MTTTQDFIKVRISETLLALFLLVASTGFGANTIPVIGPPEPGFARLDEEMLAIMEANDISAGSLSVSKDGVIVFHRVYGWQDRERTTPLRPDAIFRIASCTKPITAAAIRQLIADGKLGLHTKVFSLEDGDGGILSYEAFGDPDPRITDISVDHLLRHRGGWDRAIAGDLTYQERTISVAMGIDSPPGRVNTVRYIMSQPLQYDPGAVRAYSNIGYLILGLIIEEVSSQSFYEYVQENIIGPIGSDSGSWILGRTFKIDHDPREPFYDRPVLASNVFYPAHSNVAQVEMPYGGWDFESRVAQGRIVTSGLVLLRFMTTFQVSGDGIGTSRPPPGTWRWNHTGSLSGSNAIVRQRGDGIDYVVLFNKRPESGTNYVVQMRTTLDSLFDSGKIDTWPSLDIDDRTVPVPTITALPESGMLESSTASGRFYQWQKSRDLIRWDDFGSPFVGTGEIHLLKVAFPEESSTVFYRLTVRQ